jgi:hypothetical protein
MKKNKIELDDIGKLGEYVFKDKPRTDRGNFGSFLILLCSHYFFFLFSSFFCVLIISLILLCSLYFYLYLSFCVLITSTVLILYNRKILQFVKGGSSRISIFHPPLFPSFFPLTSLLTLLFSVYI